MENTSQHLIVVLDAIQSHWEVQQSSFINASTQSLSFPLVISALKAFHNALKLQNSENSMKIYIALGTASMSTPPEHCRLIRGNIWKASAQALCFINSQAKRFRLLVIQKAAESGEQEVALNLMIAAQHLKVEVDGLAFSDCEVLAKTSGFTGGVFMRQSSIGILQTLLQVYLPVNRPRAPPMDFKPYCFCCRKQVDRAYVCSSCLTIYCSLYHTCSKCNSRLIITE